MPIWSTSAGAPWRSYHTARIRSATRQGYLHQRYNPRDRGRAARVHLIPKRRVGAGEQALATALQPWEHQLVREALGRWSLRGTIAALGLASVVLAIGWLTPWPEADLQPWAARSVVPLLLLAVAVAVWPARTIERAADLDRRLNLGDRLSTAWAYRASPASIATLQRADAISRLEGRSPRSELQWRPARLELGALAGVTIVTLVLLIAPSPQQAVLERQAAEQAQIEQATQHLDLLRQEAAAAPSLTPDQARQLDDLLKQAQSELSHVHTQAEATGILAHAGDQLSQQLTDANAAQRDEALAAMSETLASEPLSQPLAEALQHEDPQAASRAVQSLAAEADQLSDVQRQALSRALQRASNVGRSDPRASSALHDAARALAAGESSQSALSAADAALRESMQSSSAQTAVRAATQELRDLQARLASGAPLNPNDPSGRNGADAGLASSNGVPRSAGTPVALDAGGGRTMSDPSRAGGLAGGFGSGGLDRQDQASPIAQAAENVFVPGRVGKGEADNLDLTDQPFSVRGAPRPYRDVLSQYAQSGRDYVDRPDVSPGVRALVKQYFQQLEEGR